MEPQNQIAVFIDFENIAAAAEDDPFSGHDLATLALMLDLDTDVVTRRTNPYRLSHDALDLQPGLQICFTGAAVGGSESCRIQHHLQRRSRGFGWRGGVGHLTDTDDDRNARLVQHHRFFHWGLRFSAKAVRPSA